MVVVASAFRLPNELGELPVRGYSSMGNLSRLGPDLLKVELPVGWRCIVHETSCHRSVAGRIDRLDSKLDARFNVQTVLMTVLGVLVLFGDPIRSALGL